MPAVIAEEIHPAFAELIESGKRRGFITYEELNTSLPDELVDPDKLDELLVRFDGLGIKLLDSTAHVVPPKPKPLTRLPPAEHADGDGKDAAATADKQDGKKKKDRKKDKAPGTGAE